MEQQLTRADVEKIFMELVRSQVYGVVEQIVENSEVKLKEMALLERIVRVEEELKSFHLYAEKGFTGILTEMDTKFEANQKIMVSQFKAIDDKFVMLQKTMEDRFKAMDDKFVMLQKTMEDRFKAMDDKFTANQKAMEDRFKAVDDRFKAMDERFAALNSRISFTQWLLGVPMFVLTLYTLLKGMIGF